MDHLHRHRVPDDPDHRVLQALSMSDKCQRRLDQTNGQQWWICDRCGSLWHELVNGLGWLPLSCPDRKTSAARVEPPDYRIDNPNDPLQVRARLIATGVLIDHTDFR
jgi:hypothetical protein